MIGKLKLTRRRFLVAGAAAAGGGLLVGYGVLPKDDRIAAAALLATGPDEVALNGWVKIARDGRVTVAVPRSEMGQGIYTALPMLLAEELDADWAKVRVEQAPIDKVYANVTILLDGMPFGPDETGVIADTTRWTARKVAQVLGIQATGVSTSVRDAWRPMRLAGATARTMLVAAAAAKWGVAASACWAEQGAVIHDASGRRAGYGELAAAAAEIEPSGPPKLKPAGQFKLIGQPLARLDLPAKVDGSAGFGIDTRLDGMLYAAAKTCPVFGGRVESFDRAVVADLPGVLHVVEIANGVAVVADSYWRAKRALDALPVRFDEGPNAALDSQAIYDRFMAELESGDAGSYRKEGDAPAALQAATRRIEADYRVPYLAHACMEPINCTARVDDDGCEVWVGNQAPTLVQWFAADAAGLSAEQVTVHTPLVGGGFGRRAEMEVVAQAVVVAKALSGRPVKLVWSREEDIGHDVYRPAAVARLSAGLDPAGRLTGWRHRIVSQSVTGAFTERHFPWAAMDMPDKTNADGAADLPYEIPNQTVEHVLAKTPVPVGFWRSVGHSQNAFFTEGFIDEVADAAGRDPYLFRRDLLARHPRHRQVLEVAATRAGWGEPLPAGRGRGIALHGSFGSIVAEVAEVSVSAAGHVTVHRVVCAIDCGQAVNPDTVEAQMESGIVFGLTAVLHGEITIRAGRVEQQNFPDYDMLRLAEMPRIETHIVDSGGPIGGVGEPGTPPIAPAVVNAVFDATGRRLRRLPLRPEDLAAS